MGFWSKKKLATRVLYLIVESIKLIMLNLCCQIPRDRSNTDLTSVCHFDPPYQGLFMWLGILELINSFYTGVLEGIFAY